MSLITRLVSDRHGKLPIIVLAAVVVVALCGAGILLFAGKGSAKHAKKPAEQEHLAALEEFVLNLADTAEPHYLKLEMSVGILGDGKASGGHGEGGGPLDEHLPVVRDTIISATGHYTYNNLLSAAGKEKLKADIREQLQKAVPGLKIGKVYFTNFAMQ